MVGHDVAGAARREHVGPDGGPGIEVLQLEQRQNLVRGLDHGVDTELGFDALVRGAAVDGEDVLPGALPGELDDPVRGRWLEDEHEVVAPGGPADEPGRCDRADLLVGVEDDVEGRVLGSGGVEPPEQLDDEKQPTLHVVDAGAEDPAVALAPKLGPGTDRPHGIVVTDEHDPVIRPRSVKVEQRTMAGHGFAAEPSEGGEPLCEPRRGPLGPLEVSGGGLDGDEFAQLGEILRQPPVKVVDGRHEATRISQLRLGYSRIMVCP